MQLRLNSLPNTRRTFARLLRARMNGELDQKTYRDMIYGMSVFSQFWKLEATEELQERLDALEDLLQERGIRGIV